MEGTFFTKHMNKELQAYVEQAILPRYEHFDRAHGPEHARTVIEQSLALARHYQVDRQMVYAIAAYHDVGLEKGREMHHIHSGKSSLRIQNCGSGSRRKADRRHA